MEITFLLIAIDIDSGGTMVLLSNCKVKIMWPVHMRMDILHSIIMPWGCQFDLHYSPLVLVGCIEPVSCSWKAAGWVVVLRLLYGSTLDIDLLPLTDHMRHKVSQYSGDSQLKYTSTEYLWVYTIPKSRTTFSIKNWNDARSVRDGYLGHLVDQVGSMIYTAWATTAVSGNYLH